MIYDPELAGGKNRVNKQKPHNPLINELLTF